MVPKRIAPSPNPDREIKKELEFLYSRRSAVDSLIRSLEQYNISRNKSLEFQKRRIA